MKLCDECKRTDRYATICKSEAKKKYHLTDRDLEDLETWVVRNPHYRRASGMILFKEIDLVNLFCARYSVSKFKDAIEQKQQKLDAVRKNKSQKLKATKTNKKLARRVNLLEALREYGLELRDDSKLCTGFIDGTLEKGWTVASIVERMCQMKYLFDYCNMDHYIEKAYEDQCGERKAGYFPDTSVFDQAEHMALRKHGGYPAEWPWINAGQ